MNEMSIWDKVNDGVDGLTIPELKFYESIHIPPQKWKLDPWGKQDGGFWVVGIIGKIVFWYNHIEQGFNSSKYTEFGIIDEYWCNQDNFVDAIKSLKMTIETGIPSAKTSPPIN